MGYPQSWHGQPGAFVPAAGVPSQGLLHQAADTRSPTSLGLVTGLGEDLAEGGPQAQGRVAHGEHRRSEAAIAQVTPDISPRRRALAVPELHGQELLAPVGAGADDYAYWFSGARSAR